MDNSQRHSVKYKIQENIYTSVAKQLTLHISTTKMNFIIALLQDIDIKEKIKNAPDKGYEIGVFIGSMLPFVALVLIAYLIYRYNKKQNQ